MRLIDADKPQEELTDLLDENEFILNYIDGLKESAISIIKSAPTVDAEIVVRCKECVFWDNHGSCKEIGKCLCDTLNICAEEGYDFKTEKDHFCGEGKRKGDE